MQSPFEIAPGLEVEEVLETSKSYQLSIDYPGDGWTLPEDTCRFLGELVQALRPKRVLELGSGISSVVIASELRSIDGAQLYSIDHLAHFQATAKRKINASDLSSWVSFYRCPIRPGRYFGKLLLWYRIPSTVWTQIADIDLVLVDGPPYYWGREAAMYAVFTHLKVGGLVLLDDANRAKEKCYTREWLSFYGPALEHLCLEDLGKGLAIFRKTGTKRMGQNFSLYDSYQSIVNTVRKIYINRRRLREWL